MSITGTATFVGSFAILSRRGSSHPIEHSMCESRKVSVGAFAATAPIILALIKPFLSSQRMILTFGIFLM